jgi:hypothetical protein
VSSQRAFNLLLAAALISLGVYGWLAQYAHPMGDDWSYARMGIDHPLLPWLKDQYFTWNGRYFSNILVGKGPLVLGIDHLWLYRLVPLALIADLAFLHGPTVRVRFHDALKPCNAGQGPGPHRALPAGMPDLPEGSTL